MWRGSLKLLATAGPDLEDTYKSYNEKKLLKKKQLKTGFGDWSILLNSSAALWLVMNESLLAAMGRGMQGLVRVEGMGMLQHPDPRGGRKILPAQLHAIDEVPQTWHFVRAHVHPRVHPSDSHVSPGSSRSTFLAGDVPCADPFLRCGTHRLSQDTGKTIPALSEQSFLQRDTRKVRGFQGFLCCCWSGRASCVGAARGCSTQGMYVGGTDPTSPPRPLPFSCKKSSICFPLPSRFLRSW